MLHRIYYLSGRVLESKKKWERALNFYLKIPNNTIANYRIAFCYKQRKDYGNAVYFFKQAISKEKNKAHWYFNLAESLLALNKENQAIKYFKLGLDLNPTDKKNTRVIKRIAKKLQQGIPEKEIFINSITQIDSDTVKILISGQMKENKNILQLQFTTRKNKIEIEPFSHTIDIASIETDNKGIFKASFVVPLHLLTVKNSSIINHTWDFHLMINDNKVRLKYFEDSKTLLTHHGFDIIPYKTNSKTFSILSIRKNTNSKQTDKKHITLIISRIHEETFFVQNIIKLANILVSLDYNVTLLALDLKINPNNISISPKINFNYISTDLLSEKEKDIDFNSSNVIPSKEYRQKFNNYFSTLNTDCLYIPIFGEFFVNQIISLTDKSVSKIFAEYNRKRYVAYTQILSEETNKLSIETIINKVNTKHFFKNIDSVSAIHLIYPEVESLFEKITDKIIIVTSSHEDHIIEQWSNYLEHKTHDMENVFY